MKSSNLDFWNALEIIVRNSELVKDRVKGRFLRLPLRLPHRPDFIGAPRKDNVVML